MVAGIVDDGRQQEQEERVGVEGVLVGAGGLGVVESESHQDPQSDQQTRLREDVGQFVVQVEPWGDEVKFS